MSTIHTLSETSRAGNRPSLDDLAARAAALRPALAERAQATETERRVSSEVMDMLAANELLIACKPARFGGFEYGPSALTRIGFELGQACGSTAWCTMIANLNAWFTAYWPIEAQSDVWESGSGNLVAGQLVPSGTCVPASGGYLVSGRWPYGSNAENSDWFVVTAVVPERDGQTSGACWFLVPMTELHVDQDTWFVSGLQGTGSKTVYADTAIFVPTHRVIRLADVAANATPGAGLDGNPLARFAHVTFGGVALVAPLLGMARGALDWFTDAMRSKVRPGSAVSAAHSPFNQARAGRASAGIDAALSFLLSELGAAEQVLFAGGSLDVAQRLRVRRAIGFAVRQAITVVNELYEGSGATSSALDQPMQRFWRDVNAGARHISLDDHAIMAAVGQELFGLAPGGTNY